MCVFQTAVLLKLYHCRLLIWYHRNGILDHCKTSEYLNKCLFSSAAIVCSSGATRWNFSVKVCSQRIVALLKLYTHLAYRSIFCCTKKKGCSSQTKNNAMQQHLTKVRIPTGLLNHSTIKKLILIMIKIYILLLSCTNVHFTASNHNPGKEFPWLIIFSV